jgi:hypothetical protein
MDSEFGHICTWRPRLRLLYIEKVILFDVPVLSKTIDVVHRKLSYLIYPLYSKKKSCGNKDRKQ